MLFSRVVPIQPKVSPSPRTPSPVVVKKMNVQGRVVQVMSPGQAALASPVGVPIAARKISPKVTPVGANQRVGGPSGFIQVRQNLMAANSSTIDLTDEDDVPKARGSQVVNPPALVALNAKSPQRMIQTRPAQPQHIQGVTRIIKKQLVRPAGAATSTQAALNPRVPMIRKYFFLFISIFA